MKGIDFLKQEARRIHDEIVRYKDKMYYAKEEEIKQMYSRFVKKATDIVLEEFDAFTASALLDKFGPVESVNMISVITWWILEKMEESLEVYNRLGYTDGEFPFVKEWYIEKNRVSDYVLHENHLWKVDYIVVPKNDSFETVYYLIRLEEEKEKGVVLKALREGQISMKN